MITVRTASGSLAAVLLAGATAALAAGPAAADDSTLTTGSSVVLASGVTGSPDALSAGPVAAALYDGLLLTSPDHLSSPAHDYIADTTPATVVIVGGTAAVSAAVEADIEAAAPGTTIRRVAGTDRYETAEAATELVDLINSQYASSPGSTSPTSPARATSTATH